MPQYPHRPIVQAVDRLTAQVKRIADALDTPAEEVDAALPPDNGRRVTQWVQPPPGAEEHAQAFQQWLHGVIDVRAATENMNELARLRERMDRVRKALDDRPALTTDSLYERGWNDASEMVRHALADPTP